MKDSLRFNPPVIAHRGASAYAPENTFSAFTKAAQLGIKWVEFDVMQTADGEPIIFHDESLARIAQHHGEVIDYPYAYLHTLDVGGWFDPKFSGERIPKLTQILAFLRDTNMNANIEIKALPGQEEKLIVKVLEQMSPYWNTGQTFLFSSFSLTALQLLRKHAPSCLLGLLLDEWRVDWESLAQSLDCVSIHVNEAVMTESHAHAIKATGRALLCYTVNEAKLAKRLFSWGVDAVFSDVPDRIL